MAEAEIDRLERSVMSLASSVTTLTRDISANREDISKLHDAIKLVNADVEKQGVALRRLEIDAAKEEGRKQATGDVQLKLREHDEAAREVKTIRAELAEQGEVVAKLKQAYDQQKGILVAVGVVLPILLSLVTAVIAKALGVG